MKRADRSRIAIASLATLLVGGIAWVLASRSKPVSEAANTEEVGNPTVSHKDKELFPPVARTTVSQPNADIAVDLTSTSAGQARLWVLVVDDGDRPVGNAEIYLRKFGTAVALGRTTLSGVLALSLDEPRAGEVIASHPDFAPTAASFDLAALDLEPGIQEPTLKIVLKAPGWIRGSLRVAENPAPRGITVLAFPQHGGMRVSSNLSWEDVVSDPEHPSTETDALGQFEIPVDPRRTYGLLAGGGGLMQVAPTRDVRSGDQPLAIDMAWGYALHVEYVDQDRRPIQFAGGAGRSGYSFTMKEKDPQAEIAFVPSVVAFLAGLPSEFRVDHASGPRRQTYLFRSSHSKDEIGPVQLMIAAPGYTPIEFEAWAASIRTGVPKTIVQMQQLCRGFGSVRVRVAGAGPGLELKSSPEPVYLLSLVDELGQDWKYPLRSWNGIECELGPIPAGTYTWSIGTTYQIKHLAPTAANVFRLEPNESVALEWDWSSAASLSISIRDQDGHVYSGPLVGDITPPAVDVPVETLSGLMPELLRSAPGGTVRASLGGKGFRFLGPPYRLNCLEPGLYVVSVKAPTGRSRPGRPGAQEVDLVAGTVSELKLTMELE